MFVCRVFLVFRAWFSLFWPKWNAHVVVKEYGFKNVFLRYSKTVTFLFYKENDVFLDKFLSFYTR